MMYDCNTGEGTLTITSYPVSGTVSVDGQPRGDTPLTLKLRTGKHKVIFSDYSEQFEAPGTRVVYIRKGVHETLNSDYRNRFLPNNPPDGFSPADSLRLYGTSERPLKDGTIFDYIDGGGLMYLKYGLSETTHIVYRDDRSHEITVDIFTMGTPEGAEKIFNDVEVCPLGYDTCEAGNGCKTYHYEPDFIMYFHKSKYLIYVATNNDSLKTDVTMFGTTLAGNIP
jgi:hypothetical protein